jgi:hypothetical protein
MMLVLHVAALMDGRTDGRGGESSKYMYKYRTQSEPGTHIKAVFGWRQLVKSRMPINQHLLLTHWHVPCMSISHRGAGTEQSVYYVHILIDKLGLADP